jgi:hypothetical protein
MKYVVGSANTREAERDLANAVILFRAPQSNLAKGHLTHIPRKLRSFLSETVAAWKGIEQIRRAVAAHPGAGRPFHRIIGAGPRLPEPAGRAARRIPSRQLAFE